MKLLPAQIIADIIVNDLGLPETSVWLRDQNVKIPNDQGLYVIVGMTESTPIANENYLLERPDNWDTIADQWDIPGDSWPADGVQVAEVQEVTCREWITIDVVSRSNDALTRNWEILAALSSIYSVQQQEANSFKIVRLPRSFANTSAAEGTAQLNRYSLTFAAFVWYRKIRLLPAEGGDYYDTFYTSFDTEETIQPAQTWDTPGDQWDTPGDVWSSPDFQFEISQKGIS